MNAGENTLKVLWDLGENCLILFSLFYLNLFSYGTFPRNTCAIYLKRDGYLTHFKYFRKILEIECLHVTS